MKLPAITCDAILTSVRTRADSSLGLAFSTPELQPQEQLSFLQIRGHTIKLLLQPTETAPDELVTVKSDLQQKTPSQHLRGILYVLFKQQTEVTEFPAYYEQQMRRICEAEKAKIEDPAF